VFQNAGCESQLVGSTDPWADGLAASRPAGIDDSRLSSISRGHAARSKLGPLSFWKVPTMSYLTMATALTAHERVADRFGSLLRTATDGTREVPHLTWTVGEIGAHVLASSRLYPEMLAGVATGWASLGDGEAENARLLAEIPEREPREVADALDSAGPKLREVFAGYSEEVATWHAGTRIPPAAIVGILVGDMLVHGWDIATAIDGRWIIDRPDACLSFAATTPVIPHFVGTKTAKDFTATYGIQLRRGPTFTFAFAEGRLTATEGRPPHADCRMSVDPVASLLTSYGRVPVWRPAIRGQLVSYGRRPWLGPKLSSLLVNP
jgi:Mycothiol maleylpyruvate isomerase N-terminal domain